MKINCCHVIAANAKCKHARENYKGEVRANKKRQQVAAYLKLFKRRVNEGKVTVRRPYWTLRRWFLVKDT